MVELRLIPNSACVFHASAFPVLFSAAVFLTAALTSAPHVPSCPLRAPGSPLEPWVTRLFIHALHQGHRRLFSTAAETRVQGVLGLGSSETPRPHPFGKVVAQPPQMQRPLKHWHGIDIRQRCARSVQPLITKQSYGLGVVAYSPVSKWHSEGAC